MKGDLRSILTLLFFSSILRISAQNGITGNPDWFIKPAVNYGFIYEHRATLGHLVKGYPYIVELNVGKHTAGHKLWHHENNFPDVGLNFSMMDYRNPSQLGYAFSIAPYAEIPLNSKEKRSRVVMRLCWGVAYLNKCFDVKTDPKNIAIGSHINSFVQFRWLWHLKLSKNLRFEPGLSFSHCSNARAAVPNLGLNVVTINAGFHYTIPSGKTVDVSKIDSSTKAKSRHELLVYGAFGYNQREVDADHYYCGLFSAEYHLNVRNTHKFGFGLDVFADQNYMIDYKNDIGKAPTGIDNTRMAVKFCYSYNLGRISFPVDLGYYVYEKTHPDGPVVSRIGVKYYSSSGLVYSIGLRTHAAVAYDFEYGVGYRFGLKKKREV